MSVNLDKNNEAGQTENNNQAVGPDQNERNLALLCHLSLFAGFIVFFFPFVAILIPLIIWLTKKESSKFIDETGKEVLNFQISMCIYGVGCAILTFILIGALLAVVLSVAAIVLAILGAVAASKGEVYRYPYIIRLIK